jgi:hypothetical protein
VDKAMRLQTPLGFIKSLIANSGDCFTPRKGSARNDGKCCISNNQLTKKSETGVARLLELQNKQHVTRLSYELSPFSLTGIK